MLNYFGNIKIVMENKINIAELLKDCPKGMELDCTMYDNVTLIQIQEDNTYPIKIETPDGSTVLTKYGGVSYNELSKCIIFPKGKTTWEGFVPPCEFKDGDVCYIKTKGLFEYIFIFKDVKDCNLIREHAGLCEDHYFYTENPTCTIDVVKEIRLATEEEKQKLFGAIKSHGYHWNEETKSLEKLPKFKVGNVIQDKDGYKVRITDVSIEDECYGYESLTVNGIGVISFNRQDGWELVPNKFDITTLNPFESRVLVRHNKDNKWCGSFFSHIDKDLHSHCYKFVTIAGKSYPMCIPYEKNEHLLGTTNDCDEYFKNW